MSEQGLKAVIYPEIDESGLKRFVDRLVEDVSGAFVNIGGKMKEGMGDAGASPPGGPSDNGTSATPSGGSDDDRKEEQKKDMTEAVKEGSKKASREEAEQTPEVNESKFKSVTTSLGKVANVATQAVSGVMTVQSYGKKIVEFLKGSSPALKTVLDLFETAFNLIWMPVGTIIARDLMPKISKIMQDIQGWVGEAWEVFETEGLGGVIRRAVGMSLKLVWEYLDIVINGILIPVVWEVTTVILGRIWEAIVDYMCNDFLGGFIGQIIGYISGFVDTLGKVWGFLTDTAGAVWNTIKSVLESLWNWIKPIWDSVMGPVLNTVKDILQSIWDFLVGTFGKAVEQVQDFIEDPVGSTQEGVVEYTTSRSGPIPDSVPGAVVVNKMLSWLGFAEGGVVTQATPAIVGEAGPEAIIPLDRLGQVISSASTEMNGGNVHGGNIMNFYIQGNNQTEIGDEVSRVLEKTVGKASSKMMWW